MSSVSSSFDDLDLSVYGPAIAVGVLVFLVTLVHRMSRPEPVALCKDFEAWPLIDKKELSHDTRRFTFGFPNDKSNRKLGLPTGQHLTLQFTDTSSGGGSTQRSYTPVSHADQRGSVSFCIKVYRPAPPKFPKGGKMSQHLDSLAIGDTINVRGPKGHLHYEGCGKFSVSHVRHPTEHRTAKHIGMIAGGTGITPMLQVLHAIFDNPNDRTKCKLLYANQSVDDILVQPELEALASAHPDRFQVYYTVDRAPPGNVNWTQGVGFITGDMIAQHLYAKPQMGMQIQVFMCGPPMMVKRACLPNLQELGFTERDWYVF